jgi:hypothetical protein
MEGLMPENPAERSRRDIFFEKFINSSTVILILLGFSFLLLPEHIWPDFYSPIFFGMVDLSSAIILYAFSHFFSAKRDKCKREAVMFVRFSIAVAMWLNILGELYLYQLYNYGIQYDKILHVISPFLFMVTITSFIEVWFGIRKKKAIFMAITIVMAGSVCWELFEYLSDKFLYTKEFGVYGQFIFTDTLFDLSFDILGVGAAYYCFQNSRFYNLVVIKYCQSNKN